MLGVRLLAGCRSRDTVRVRLTFDTPEGAPIPLLEALIRDGEVIFEAVRGAGAQRRFELGDRSPLRRTHEQGLACPSCARRSAAVDRALTARTLADLADRSARVFPTQHAIPLNWPPTQLLGPDVAT